MGATSPGWTANFRPELAAGTAIAPRQPTPYRYAALIARAKELIQNAAQMEAALLAALEKHDAESYNLLKAIQDVELASETVRLQDLRVIEAMDGIRLAALQKDRAQIQFDHFDGLINEGVSDNGDMRARGSGLLGPCWVAPARVLAALPPPSLVPLLVQASVSPVARHWAWIALRPASPVTSAAKRTGSCSAPWHSRMWPSAASS